MFRRLWCGQRRRALTTSDARNDLLQRSLAILLRRSIHGSEVGVPVTLDGDRSLPAMPRLLGVIVHQPQERSLLCMMCNACAQPCSFCIMKRDIAGSHEAEDAPDRDPTALVEA